MPKTAFLFPGQGSQYIGMGKELASQFDVARDVFAQADEKLGFSISKLCFEGPEEALKQTSNTQPALLTTSLACYQVLVSQGVSPDFVAGHSLGEYSALVAAGSLSFTEAVTLVHQRGLLMEEAYPSGQGGMAAVLGLNADQVVDVCNEAASYGIVQAANFNCPGQVVIAGEKAALEQAMVLAKEAGAKRAIPLAVSGPFHSELMNQAGEKLASVLDKVNIIDPKVPIIANVSVEILSSKNEIKQALIKQISQSVRWEETLKKLYSLGVRNFIEVGPDKVLSGLVKKTVKDVLISNVQDRESLEKTLALVKGDNS